MLFRSAVRATPALALTADKDAKAGLSIFNPLILGNLKGKEKDSGKGKGKAVEIKDESLFALSTRIVGSLTEYLDWSFGRGTGASAVDAVKDMQEVLDALDDLMSAIHKQTTLVWEQSRNTAEGVRAQLRERHNRAKRNAKKLKALGGQFFASLGKQIQERHGHASSGARKLREISGHFVRSLGEHVRERVDVAKSNARALREGKRILSSRRALKADEMKEARRVQWASSR